MLPVSRATLAPPAGPSRFAPPAPAQPRPLPVDTFVGGPRTSAATGPGSWRGGPDTEIGRAVIAMRERLAAFDHLELKGQTPSEVFANAILDNPRVSNAQLLAMTKVPLSELADSPADAAKVLEKIPDARSRTSHQFTVALLSAATGIDPSVLSQGTPSLGMTGAPGTPLLYAPRTERMGRSTALHDFTDYLRGAGVEGLNRAVWGVEDRILSALKSALGRWRY